MYVCVNVHSLQWSYGVTCWEIFSLGRIPYPGVDNAEVIKTLKTGERLDKPDLCPSDLYVHIMCLDCNKNFSCFLSFISIDRS